MSDNQHPHNPYQTPQAGIVAPATLGKPHPVLGVLAGGAIVFAGWLLISLMMALMVLHTPSGDQQTIIIRLVSPTLHLVVDGIAAYLCARLALRQELVAVLVLLCVTNAAAYVFNTLVFHKSFFFVDLWSFVTPFLATLVGGWLAWVHNRKAEERYLVSQRPQDAGLD